MKLFECGDCRKHFSQACGLRSHRRVHTGERPYGCEDCGKRFSHLYDLKCHIRIHTGERPFVCEVCEKRFSQGTNLNSHRRVHLQVGSKPTPRRRQYKPPELVEFNCELCTESSFTRLGLLKHTRAGHLI
ncbi:hypothetical protein BASA81_000539 [Batrachochytrium salamandrivorans]|nr:hypothetical protein BASA81_000539 [Batrachochytrium salamandrivorans]